MLIQRGDDRQIRKGLVQSKEVPIHSPLAVQIGARIRKARISRRLKLDELAEQLQVPSNRLILLEKGQAKVDAAELWELSLRLRQPISYFFSIELVRGCTEAEIVDYTATGKGRGHRRPVSPEA